MTTSRFSALPLTLALLPPLAGAMLLPQPVAAQAMAPGMPHGMAPGMPPGMHMQHAGHIEGHIAFLKAELKISPAQEALFAKVAAAMREDAAAIGQARQQWDANRQATPTAVQVLEMRVSTTAMRARSEDRFLAAFRPLYDSLSTEQKQAADELLAERDLR